MTPTNRLLWLSIAWTLLGCAPSIEPTLLPWWVGFGILFAVLAGFDLLLGKSRSKWQVTRRLPGRFALNQPGEVQLVITNLCDRALKFEIFDGVPNGAATDAMPWTDTVASGELVKLQYRVTLCERGLVSFSGTHVRVKSPLGLWKIQAVHGEMQEVKVYPDYEPVVKYALLAIEAREGQMGIVRKSLAGATQDFHQLREYREGDSLAQIDWKATSRRSLLISREFQEQKNQTITFLVDTGRRMRAIDGDLPQIDHCLNAVLLLSYLALRQGDAVSVHSFGGADRWLPPIRGVGSMATLLNHLFDFQTTTAPSDFTAAVKQLQTRQRRRSMVVLMTNLRGEDGSELIPALRTLHERHLVVLASLREKSVTELSERTVTDFQSALAYAAAAQYERERNRILLTLSSLGVPTLNVTAQQLPLALANQYLEIKRAGRL